MATGFGTLQTRLDIAKLTLILNVAPHISVAHGLIYTLSNCMHHERAQRRGAWSHVPHLWANQNAGIRGQQVQRGIIHSSPGHCATLLQVAQQDLEPLPTCVIGPIGCIGEAEKTFACTSQECLWRVWKFYFFCLPTCLFFLYEKRFSVYRSATHMARLKFYL